ncbi:MAG: antitoxin Xre/MbcA/ParS toxin-binding domain-containing protein [Paracoccaceae bacterium]
MENAVQERLADASSEDGRLVAKAVVRAGLALGLKQAEIAEAIGVSAPQVSRMKEGVVPVAGKSLELALYLIRVFRSLDAISGGDTATNRAWMRNRNTDLNGVPAELVRSAAGLVAVMGYLDAARAPL